MATILHIDSSHENAFVSLAENGVIMETLENRIQKDHAAFLHVAIKEILTKLDIHISSLNAVAVTAGPGSYTGLRVGFAAAKGLCYAANKPLISVGTLKMLTRSAMLINPADPEMLWCPIIDARRNEVYTALYDADLKEIRPAHALVLTHDNFEQHFGKRKICFFGNGAEKLKTIYPEKTLSLLQTGDNAQALSLLAFQQFSENEFADLALAAPVYAKEFYNG